MMAWFNNSHYAASSLAARFFILPRRRFLCASRLNAFGVERQDWKTDETD
jgi:hypothetical protein